jgi:hypothetical protein
MIAYAYLALAAAAVFVVHWRSTSEATPQDTRAAAPF